METYSFNTFEIIKNETKLPNEFITHRIELIPIYNYIKDEKVEDLEFTLDVECIDEQEKYVYSGDIKSSDGNQYFKSDIIIHKIFNGEKINLTGKIEKGNANMHSKWCPITVCEYDYNKDNEYKTELGIEQLGQMDSKTCLTEALQKIIEKLDNCKKSISSKNNDHIEILDDLVDNFYKIILHNEDHTIGHILNNEIENNKNINFCGYHIPHPFAKQLIIRARIISKEKIDKIIIDSIDNLIEIYEKIKKIINNKL